MPPTRHRRIRHPSRPKRHFPLQTVLVTIGVLGLVGLALALFGTDRFEREILGPVREAALPRAEKLWADARPLRSRLGELFAAAGEGKSRLVEDFRDWIDGFRAA